MKELVWCRLEATKTTKDFLRSTEGRKFKVSEWDCFLRERGIHPDLNMFGNFDHFGVITRVGKRRVPLMDWQYKWSGSMSKNKHVTNQKNRRFR